jgi:2'-5' RNA ligase
MEDLMKYPLNQKLRVDDFYDYELVVIPTVEVATLLKIECEKLSRDYHSDTVTECQPNILIARFIAREEMEETIIRYMRRILSREQRFNVSLNNYSGFPEHAVYARIQDHLPFRHLAASLKVVDQYLSGNGCPSAAMVTHPHVLIASGLKESVYREAMFEYSRKTFHVSFEVKEVVLLKRRSEYEQSKKVNVFGLL